MSIERPETARYMGVEYQLFDEGWTAECEGCNTVAAYGKTKRECLRVIKEHIAKHHAAGKGSDE